MTITPEHQQRIVRVPITPALIRQIDEIVHQRRAGYESRSELIVDAIEAFVLELTHPIDDRSSTSEKLVAPEGSPRDFRSTSGHWPTIQAPQRGALLAMRTEAPTGPLFGLHNRDFPSIWALSRLAFAARHAPVPANDFLSQIGEDAWNLASAVLSNHPDSAKSSLALFPTNERKREASQKSFVTFAIGEVGREGRSLTTNGPLFVWRVVAADIQGDDVVVAPTEGGYALLDALDGLSLEQPRVRQHAEAFLNYLEEHAPGDFWGFEQTVVAISHGTDRASLVGHFSDARPDWSANVAATNTAGYVARCREWGLVKPEQQDRKYILTEFGLDLRERAA